MFIIFSFGHRTIKSFGSMANQICDNCHNSIGKEILKVTTWFTLFFIPVIPYRTEYMIICPICRSALKISKVDFEQIIDGGYQSLQSGSIIGTAVNPQRPSVEVSPQNKYAGKTQTQIEYLKQMEELVRQKEQQRSE